MIQFLLLLLLRNPALFVFGSLNLLAALVFLVLTQLSKTQVTGVNAWFKPFKFALSIGILAWTMAWFMADLNAPQAIAAYNWAFIATLGFEIVYIAIQAYRGQMSHFNFSSPFYQFLFMLMGFAAALITLWTGYIGILFFQADLSTLPDYYILSIRLGIILFVIFSFEGAVMGAKAQHTVGAPDGSPGIPLLNWSTQFGDLRIAHFMGMHALQVLPLLSWYVLKSTLAAAIAGTLYGLLAVYTLVLALKGNPMLKR